MEGGALVKFMVDVWGAKFKRYVAKFEATFGPQQGPPDDHPLLVEEPEGHLG